MAPAWLQQILAFLAMILGIGFLINLNILARTATRYLESKTKEDK